MEYKKIMNLPDTTSDNLPRFNTKKWIQVHDQSGESCNINKQIRFKTALKTAAGQWSLTVVTWFGTAKIFVEWSP